MIIGFLRLIRPVNLLIIALTMYLVRHFIIIPIFRITETLNPFLPADMLLKLTEPDFGILVLSVVLIAAAANVINDYFDQRIDAINKPARIIIGKQVSPKQAMRLYMYLNIAAVLLSGYISWKSGSQLVILVNVLAMGSLWFYSERLKKIALLGNLVIAVFSGLVLLMPAIPEKEFYVNIVYVLIYAAFGFMLTLIREIVKDMEDVEGDVAEGCKTLPVLLGIKWTRITAFILTVLHCAFLSYVIYKNFSDNVVTSFGNIITLALLPYLPLFFMLMQSETKKDFHRISIYVKGLMLLGILSIVPLYYLFLKT